MDRAEKAAVPPTAAPTPTAALTAPKFLGPLCSAVALPKAGALDLKTGLDIGLAEGGTKDALQLPASSSSAPFLARACLSDHVNFLVTPGVEEGLAERLWRLPLLLYFCERIPEFLGGRKANWRISTLGRLNSILLCWFFGHV